MGYCDKPAGFWHKLYCVVTYKKRRRQAEEKKSRDAKGLRMIKGDK